MADDEDDDAARISPTRRGTAAAAVVAVSRPILKREPGAPTSADPRVVAVAVSVRCRGPSAAAAGSAAHLRALIAIAVENEKLDC